MDGKAAQRRYCIKHAKQPTLRIEGIAGTKALRQEKTTPLEELKGQGEGQWAMRQAGPSPLRIFVVLERIGVLFCAQWGTTGLFLVCFVF